MLFLQFVEPNQDRLGKTSTLRNVTYLFRLAIISNVIISFTVALEGYLFVP